ncbi:DUF domain-containing protein, partial [Vibrio cholerae]|nr:DUF domain-containing protein [Vibrio cholerae]
LKTINKEVGKKNVVQIVTDNGSVFMKVGKQLMKNYNLCWTSCAVHCIDLIFEDIGKRSSVIKVINNARKITNFIYNH